MISWKIKPLHAATSPPKAARVATVIGISEDRSAGEAGTAITSRTLKVTFTTSGTEKPKIPMER